MLIPFAPGTSAAWMSGSLNETIPSLAGNANAPPSDTLRATIGLSAANRLLSRAASESSSGNGGSIQATVLRASSGRPIQVRRPRRSPIADRKNRPGVIPSTRRMTSPTSQP